LAEALRCFNNVGCCGWQTRLALVEFLDLHFVRAVRNVWVALGLFLLLTWAWAAVAPVSIVLVDVASKPLQFGVLFAWLPRALLLTLVCHSRVLFLLQLFTFVADDNMLVTLHRSVIKVLQRWH
jgi:hypothetical protein